MTAIRIYGLIWLLALSVTAVLYFVGFINEMTFPIFGFAYSTLAVMGFVAVLPAWLNEHHTPKTYPVAKNL
jgi:hypothetical protein